MSLFASLLNNWFSVARRTRLSDAQGGFTLAYVPISVVRGRIRPASSGEIERAAEEQRQITHVLYVAHGTDIARGDRVQCDDLIVDVLGVREPSKASHHLEIDCQEVQLETAVEAGS